MTDTRQLWLGVLILSSLGILGVYTLFGSNLNLFGTKLYLEAEFPAAKGARKGDSVTLAGVRVGTVTEVTFRPEAPDTERILVRMRIDETIEIREGYEVSIENATLLGGRLVAIEPGPYGARALPLSDGTVLTGTVPPDIFESFEALGEVIGEEGDSIRGIIDDLSTIIGDLREGDLSGNLNRGVDSIANAGESIERLTAQVERGEGTVGRLFQSEELFDNWNSVGANLDELLVTAREGDGVIGRLVSDAELGARVDETVGEIRGAAGNLRELTAGVTGSGSVVDRILHDEQLGQDLSGIGTDLRSFSGRLANADGTVARLIDSPDLYDTFLAAGQDVRSITSQVASGEGTLGRLIYSDEIYDEVALAIRTANRGLEDYREAAPITTFTNLIFAGF